MTDDLLSCVIVPPLRDAASPCLTYLDPRSGERTELSGRTVSLWVCKTANFVSDELGLGPGEVLALRLPNHWQAWSWLFGAWLAGAVVDLGSPGDPVPDDAAAAVLERDRVDDAATQPHAVELISLALRPMALPGPPPPGGVIDYDTNIRAHGDRYRALGAGPTGALRTVDGTVPWPRLTTPSAPDEGPGRRLVTSLTPSTAEAVAAVVGALAAGSGVVLLAVPPDPTAEPRLDALHLDKEGVTHATGELSILLA